MEKRLCKKTVMRLGLYYRLEEASNDMVQNIDWI